MIRSLYIASSLIGAGLVAGAFLQGGLFWYAGVFILLFILSFITAFRYFQPGTTASLLIFFGFIVLGILLDLNPVILITGSFLSLAAWDLADFSRRLRLAGTEADLTGLQNYHLLRLGIVLLVGVGLTVIALNWKIKISFGWVAILSIICAGGVGILLHRLLKND